ncbi:hypothetical protein D3C76_505480 [compost metagenome]
MELVHAHDLVFVYQVGDQTLVERQVLLGEEGEVLFREGHLFHEALASDHVHQCSLLLGRSRALQRHVLQVEGNDAGTAHVEAGVVGEHREVADRFANAKDEGIDQAAPHLTRAFVFGANLFGRCHRYQIIEGRHRIALGHLGFVHHAGVEHRIDQFPVGGGRKNAEAQLRHRRVHHVVVPGLVGLRAGPLDLVVLASVGQVDHAPHKVAHPFVRLFALGRRHQDGQEVLVELTVLWQWITLAQRRIKRVDAVFSGVLQTFVHHQVMKPGWQVVANKIAEAGRGNPDIGNADVGQARQARHQAGLEMVVVHQHRFARTRLAGDQGDPCGLLGREALILEDLAIQATVDGRPLLERRRGPGQRQHGHRIAQRRGRRVAEVLGGQGQAVGLERLHRVAGTLDEYRLPPCLQGAPQLRFAQRKFLHAFLVGAGPGHRGNLQLYHALAVAHTLAQFFGGQVDVAVLFGGDRKQLGKQAFPGQHTHAIGRQHDRHGVRQGPGHAVFLGFCTVEAVEQGIEVLRLCRRNRHQQRRIHPRADPNAGGVWQQACALATANFARGDHDLTGQRGVHELRLVIAAVVGLPAHRDCAARNVRLPATRSNVGVHLGTDCANRFADVEHIGRAAELGGRQVFGNLGDEGKVAILEVGDGAQQVLRLGGSGPVRGFSELVGGFAGHRLFSLVKQRGPRPEHQVAFFVIHILRVLFYPFIDQVAYVQVQPLGGSRLLQGVLLQRRGGIQVTAEDNLQVMAAHLEVHGKRCFQQAHEPFELFATQHALGAVEAHDGSQRTVVGDDGLPTIDRLQIAVVLHVCFELAQNRQDHRLEFVKHVLVLP